MSYQAIYDKISIIPSTGTDINITWQGFITANRFEHPKKIVKLTDYVMNQQTKQLGHIIRTDPLDPMWQPTINTELRTHGVFPHEVGRPR